jgi:hypothetical protein
MAGFLEHYPAPAKSDVGSESNLWVNITVTLTFFLILFVLAIPFAVLGMLVAYVVWKITRPSMLTIVVLSVACAVALVVESNMVAWLWPWGVARHVR